MGSQKPFGPTEEQMREAAVGGLVGVHAGDSLGATLEFGPGRDPDDYLTDIVGGGPFRWDAGDPTDDTDLTLAVARAYLDVDGDDTDEVVAAAAGHMVDWYRAGPRDIGGTTREALRRVDQGVPPDEAGATHEMSAANGSLMRCLPTAVAVADDDLRREHAARISRITHAEPRAVDACVAYTDIASWMLDGATAEDAIRRSVETSPVGETTREAIREVLDDPGQPPPWDSGGYVLTSLRLAVWAALQRRPASQVLVEVVNLGGDTDTNGAIAGGLLGIRDSVSAFPARWTSKLKAAPELEQATGRLLDIRRRR